MVAGGQRRWNEGELTVGIGLRLGDDGAPIEQSDFGIGCRPPGDDRIPCRLDPDDIEAGPRRLPSLRRGRCCRLRLRMVHGAGRASGSAGRRRRRRRRNDWSGPYRLPSAIGERADRGSGHHRADCEHCTFREAEHFGLSLVGLPD